MEFLVKTSGVDIKSPAIFLMGPTASGKTGAAVHCYSKLPIEIISVDSALVFKDMNIGNAGSSTASFN
jgi:tRNA dimethylallyltransferase